MNTVAEEPAQIKKLKEFFNAYDFLWRGIVARCNSAWSGKLLREVIIQVHHLSSRFLKLTT